jgi:uncharacterized protein YndB with AHSA1/START domain
VSQFGFDWTRFERWIFIDAPPETVFRAWAVPREIIRWYIAKASYVAADGTPRPESEVVASGDEYQWEWHQDLRSKGTVLEVEENERLVFTFGDKEPGSGQKIIVTVTVSAVEDGTTLLRLVQENMADTPEAHVRWHMQCNLGWSFFMTNLKGLLEYGIDLRETDRDRAYDARAMTH